MFLTVYLSNNDQHFTEVPVTPDTLCRDVLDLCKEPGETDCHLAEVWRGSERAVGDGERMMDVLQRWGQHRSEVRFFLRHRAPIRDSGERARAFTPLPHIQHPITTVGTPRMDMTLAELQEMAARQQQQIEAQQQLLASKEQRLRYLKQQEQRQQQQTAEQEKLQRLRENIDNQEIRLKKVRALKGQVEQKRLSNGKLVEEIEQMNSLFQQKQRELVLAATKVEELSRQLELLKSGKMEGFHDNQTSVAELDRLYKELQLRNKLNQEQNSKLQHQRDSLNKRNLEVASMDKRITELRERLYKKKAALQQKENLPVSINNTPQSGPSRVAAVGPYIQSSTMPRGPVRNELLVKPAYPDGTATLPTHDHQGKAGTGKRHSRGESTHDDGEMKRDKKARPASMFEPTDFQANSLRKNQSSDDLVRDAQRVCTLAPSPRPSPTASSISSSPVCTLARAAPLCPLPEPDPTPALQTGHPPAATVRPFTPELPKDSRLGKPQSLDASSIYSMYTQQLGIQGALSRAQNRNGFTSVYGKPVLSGFQQQLENPYLDRRSPTENEVDHNAPSQGAPQSETERTPRPLSPTKLLPFITNPYRHQSDGDLEALRKKLYNAPRPLKKRSSITEPEGPAGPNIQKLLYQKTTLAAMETTVTPATPAFALDPEKTPESAPVPVSGADVNQSEPEEVPPAEPTPPEQTNHTPSIIVGNEEIIPPPPPSHPAPRPDEVVFPPSPPSADGEEILVQVPNMPPPPPPEGFLEDFPPYPPPPYPSGAEQDSLSEESMKAPEVTGQVTLPPGKRTNLRKQGSERIDHSMRVKFNPLALLLDSSLEGEYDLVQRIIYEVEDPSLPNDEGITALHNAVCAGHTEIVKFLVQFGVNVNAADSDGWTPLHCAASCNNVQVCKFLVESGAAVFAMTYSDMQTAADKCEEMEEGYTQCSQFLYGVQEKMGIMNRGVVYGLWDYGGENPDELAFREGDCMTILRREDEEEIEWWWARMGDHEGYIPRNLLGLYPRIKPRQRSLA
uniref:Tumor protein p53 binding protein, 2a n=1 Tax=Neogobius melanostomus TaxID=47308 RepID=A0A8C6URL2_9GOBI